MTFSLLIEFCQNAVGYWYEIWAGDAWELLLMPIGTAYETILGNFMEVPSAPIDFINNIFGDMSVALLCFTLAPLVVAFLAILGILLGILL